MAETPVTVRITDVEVGAIRLAVSSAGEPGAPLVVLLHGFPDIGYAWRHQIRSLAAADYRVIAPDQRGHGWSEAPDGDDAYRIDQLVADVLGLLDAEDATSAVVVGHDWGSHVATTTALMAPDRVRAVALLSTPYVQRSELSLLAEARVAAPDDPIRILADVQDPAYTSELHADPLGSVRAIQWRACGQRPDDWEPGQRLPAGPPPYLSAGEFENYFRAYAKSGFDTPTSVLRNVHANWLLTEPWLGATLDVPTLFAVGDQDPAVQVDGSVMGRHIAALRSTCAKLRGPHLIEGAGHWLQQEAPEQVTDLLLAFLEDIA